MTSLDVVFCFPEKVKHKVGGTLGEAKTLAAQESDCRNDTVVAGFGVVVKNNSIGSDEADKIEGEYFVE